MDNTLTLDHEWIELMKEARDQGFTKEEVMSFLQNPQLIAAEYAAQEN
ncbi:anti-repressor SinI family protein [Fictibacillus phosphorivorans]|nr:anti-repressor SinI family protein [Fictibacillus phosphorivorans]